MSSDADERTDAEATRYLEDIEPGNADGRTRAIGRRGGSAPAGGSILSPAFGIRRVRSTRSTRGGLPEIARRNSGRIDRRKRKQTASL